MFDRFNDAARRVMARANQAAIRLGHDEIDACHVLVGVANEGGMAAGLLRGLGCGDGRHVEHVVARLVPPGTAAARGKLPLTAAGKAAYQAAMANARSLGDGQVEPEHLLLAVMAGADGTVAEADALDRGGPA